MQSRNRIVTAALTLFMALPNTILAQSSSINTFSPYTFYGIGDFNTPGTSCVRSMGGAGVAYRSGTQINYLNPASGSAMLRQSFLFNFGAEGANYYLKNRETTSSYNSFNINNIGIQFPVARGIGFSMSVAPYSSVGYRVTKREENVKIVGGLGDVQYHYSGEGGITQAKAGFGVRVIPRLSLGAEMVYYFGNINHGYLNVITRITGEGDHKTMSGTHEEQISRIFSNFGVQYDFIASPKRILTAGATFQPGGKLKPKVTQFLSSEGDTISFSSFRSDFVMASSLSAGVFFQTPKLGAGADYMYQNWGGKNNENGSADPVRYVNTHSVRIGAQYTPDRNNIRYMLRRWTYRAGFRYNTYYMQLNKRQIDDKVITCGVGFPLRRGSLSELDLGLEFGQRGTTQKGLIRENYFKISIGLNLFGADEWFMKRKYN